MILNNTDLNEYAKIVILSPRYLAKPSGEGSHFEKPMFASL